MDNAPLSPRATPWQDLDPVIQADWDRLMQQVGTPPLMVELSTSNMSVQDFNPRELAEKVALDAVLAGRLLAVVNSAKFGLSEPMTSVQRTMVHLGFNLVKSVITSYLLEHCFSDPLPVHPEHIEFVRHWSALASVLTYRWAQAAELPDPSSGATVALLARTGTLVLGLGQPAPDLAYREIPDQVSRLAHEASVWQVTTPALSYRLTQLWGIPEPIPTLLGLHLAPVLTPLSSSPFSRSLALVAGSLVLAECYLHDAKADCPAILDRGEYITLKMNLAQHHLLDSLSTTWSSARLQRELAAVLIA